MKIRVTLPFERDLEPVARLPVDIQDQVDPAVVDHPAVQLDVDLIESDEVPLRPRVERRSRAIAVGDGELRERGAVAEAGSEQREIEPIGIRARSGPKSIGRLTNLCCVSSYSTRGSKLCAPSDFTRTSTPAGGPPPSALAENSPGVIEAIRMIPVCVLPPAPLTVTAA